MQIQNRLSKDEKPWEFLKSKNVNKRFGGLQALGNVNLIVSEKYRPRHHRSKRCRKVNSAELPGRQADP